MRLHPRRRFLLRRLGSWTCGVLALVIVLSQFVAVDWVGAELYLGIDRGALFFSTRPSERPAGLTVSAANASWRSMFNAFPAADVTVRGLYWRGWLPLWIPLALVALPTFVLWWLERRPYPPGRCQQCGYDLTGNTTGICPECGVTAE